MSADGVDDDRGARGGAGALPLPLPPPASPVFSAARSSPRPRPLSASGSSARSTSSASIHGHHFDVSPFSTHFVLGKEIARGNYGRVFAATRRVDGLQVAAKFIKVAHTPPHAATLERARLMQEIEMHRRATALRIPGILRLLSVHEPADRPAEIVMVLELSKGGELFECIQSRSHFTEACAAGAFRQIATALAALHAAGIVHRDVKPENILLRESAESCANDSQLALIDFGLAFSPGEADAWDSSFRKHNVGTRQYEAPELLGSAANAPQSHAPAIDAWALGVVLFIMLAGYPPFRVPEVEDGDDSPRAETRRDAELFALVSKGAAGADFSDPVWDEISQPAKDLISALLTVDVGRRLTPADALHHPWISTSCKVPLSSVLPPLAHLSRTQDNLKRQLARKRVRRAVHVVMATRRFSGTMTQLANTLPSIVIEPALLESLGAAFRAAAAADKNGDGATIGVAGLRSVLLGSAELGLSASAVNDLLQNKHLFTALDANEDDVVDWREFVALLPLLTSGVRTPLRDLPDESLRVFVALFDTRGEGVLDTEDLTRLVKMLGVQKGEVSAGELEGLFAAAVEDTLDYTQLRQLICNLERPPLQEMLAQ